MNHCESLTPSHCHRQTLNVYFSAPGTRLTTGATYLTIECREPFGFHNNLDDQTTNGCRNWASLRIQAIWNTEYLLLYEVIVIVCDNQLPKILTGWPKKGVSTDPIYLRFKVMREKIPEREIHFQLIFWFLVLYLFTDTLYLVTNSRLLGLTSKDCFVLFLEGRKWEIN